MMNRNSIALCGIGESERGDVSIASTQRIVEFYEEAGTVFSHWSRELNIHLGLYRFGMNPFDREAMFDELNLEVARRLRVGTDDIAIVLDLGCGFGAVSRTVARRCPAAAVKGVTLSPLQVRIASEIDRACGLESRIEILEQDFTKLAFSDRSVDAAWAIESACYGAGPNKTDFVREAARVLKPGGRLVIVDCFMKDRKLGPILTRCHEAACRNWAVPEMPVLRPFTEALKEHGFVNVVVEDRSCQAALSVIHAPFAVISFVAKYLFTGRPINRESRNNLKASLLALLIGISHRKFRYCLVTCERSGEGYIRNETVP